MKLDANGWCSDVTRLDSPNFDTPQLLGLWRQCTPFLPNRISDKGDHAQNYE